MRSSGGSGEASVDAINRRCVADPQTVAHYGQNASWLDRGEKLLLHSVAEEVRGRPVLDVGVGPGRTAWLMRLLTADYTAIDYSPEMVAACLEECPGVSVREADARDLSMFGDAAFKLVFFSFNGLDALNHDDRVLALSEFHRVLEPGGLLLYSAMNRSGPTYGRRPWELEQLRRIAQRFALAPGVPPLQRVTRPVSSFWRSYRRWKVSNSLSEEGTGWAMGTSHAHEFGVVLHYTLPSAERRLLEELGFEVEALLDSDGVTVANDSTVTPWFYLLARKPRA